MCIMLRRIEEKDVGKIRGPTAQFHLKRRSSAAEQERHMELNPASRQADPSSLL